MAQFPWLRKALPLILKLSLIVMREMGRFSADISRHLQLETTNSSLRVTKNVDSILMILHLMRIIQPTQLGLLLLLSLNHLNTDITMEMDLTNQLGFPLLLDKNIQSELLSLRKH